MVAPTLRTHRYRRSIKLPAPTLAVLTRLSAVSADLHRAPGGRAVARVVVEEPAAVSARLETRPRPVQHGAHHDREHAPEHAVEAARVRLDDESRARIEDRLDAGGGGGGGGGWARAAGGG